VIRTTPRTTTTTSSTTTAAPPTTTNRRISQIAAAPPAKADPSVAVHKQRGWSLTVLILIVGIGAASVAMKRRVR
jgi:hypothetical protein